ISPRTSRATKMKSMTIVSLIAVLLSMQCVRAQSQSFDLASLIPTRGSEPIWTTINKNLPQVQGMIDAARRQCIQSLGMPKDQRPLMKEPNPTEKEKCLIECVLKKIKMIDGTNKLNIAQVEKLTSLVTQDNKVAIAISCSMAQNCNRSITEKKPCQAAHLFNQCIGRHLERNNVKLVW
ncbi:hypothetical protein KR074_003243, partial [Drosophila pseudoananassae]